MGCGSLAHYSHRTAPGDSLVLLGETDAYVPLCRGCYQKVKQGAEVLPAINPGNPTL